jgi:hypothetical protein
VECRDILYKNIFIHFESPGDHIAYRDCFVKMAMPHVTPSCQSDVGRASNMTEASAPRKHDPLIVEGTRSLYGLLHDHCFHGFAHITFNHVIFTPTCQAVQ